MPFLATGFVPWLARRTFRGGAVGEPGTITWDGAPETLVEVADSAGLTVCFNNGTWLAMFGEGDERVEALVYVDADQALHFWVRRRDASTGIWTWAEQATSADVPPIDPTKTLPPTFSKAAITIHQEVSTYAHVWWRRTRYLVAAPRYTGGSPPIGLSLVTFSYTEEIDGSDSWAYWSVQHEDIDVSSVVEAPEDVSIAVVPGASATSPRVYVAFGGEVAGSGGADRGVWLWDSSTGSITELGVSDSTVSATLYPRLVSIAADPDRWVAVWRKQGAVDAGSGHTVAAATARHGAAMGTPDNIAGARLGEADASDPAVAASPSGGFIVGFQQGDEGDPSRAAMALTSRDGSTWSTAAEMSITDTSAPTWFNAFVRPAASEAWTVAGWESRETAGTSSVPSLVYTASATNPTGAPEAAGGATPIDPAVTTPDSSYDQTFPSPAIVGDRLALVWRESDGATWRLKYLGGQVP